jgi:hypothetical protein
MNNGPSWKSRWLLIFAVAARFAMPPGAFADSMLQLFPDTGTRPSPQASVGSHLQGAPLPSGPGTPTEKDFTKMYSAWLDRVLVAHLPANTDPTMTAYVHATVATLEGGKLTSQIIEQSRSFNLDTITDPGLLFLVAFVDPTSPHGVAAMKKSVDGMPGSSYPKFIWFMAAANYGKSLKSSNMGTPDQIAAADLQSLDYLKQGLADGSFQPNELSALRIRLSSPSGKDLISRNGQEVGQILESSTGVSPWVAEYIEGCQAVEDAWKARGADWAKNVTAEGWKGFEQNIALARAHLTKSWQLNPHDPAAAAEMITVCMAENEEHDTMRTWFDRSVAVDFDYMEAYSNLAMGLRPRWLGNFEEMTAFGRECEATGRYDTPVPYMFVTTGMTLASDSDNPATPFEDLKLDGEILSVLDNYYAEPKPPIPAQFAHTIAAIMAHKLGRMDEVRKHLAAINYQPVMNELYEKIDDIPALVQQAQASPSP